MIENINEDKIDKIVFYNLFLLNYTSKIVNLTCFAEHLHKNFIFCNILLLIAWKDLFRQKYYAFI